MLVYALTIFLGAFLLFQVQPLLGKFILPWFGGGPGVWTTCLLFFQILLLAGYAYAHATSRFLAPRRQAVVHLLLLVAAVALLPIIPSDAWKPMATGNPTLQILLLLSGCVGVPYFVLSTTGPLLQHWFSRTNPGVSPYRLYALSNVGSLLALLSYPIYFETHFSRRVQASLWAGSLILYAISCGFCALRLWRLTPSASNQAPTIQHPVSVIPHPASRIQYPSWLLLPACASLLLLATTNKLCQDVAVVPFLWIVPLALYLLSFIICFDSPRWYHRLLFTPLLVVALIGFCWALAHGSDWSLWRQILVYCGSLFVCCMVCHGELYRLRPAPERLTGFYLAIAAGGALGGLFVAVIAPMIFSNYYELHWGVFLCGILFLIVWAWPGTAVGNVETQPSANEANYTEVDRIEPAVSTSGGGALLVQSVVNHSGVGSATLPKPAGGDVQATRVSWPLDCIRTYYFVLRTSPSFRWLITAALTGGIVFLGRNLWGQARHAKEGAVSSTRNFYGVLSVFEYRKNEPKGRNYLLLHGRITHGFQFVDPVQATWPVSYYGEGSGVNLAWNALPLASRRLGVVGLGTGTLASFARPGDYVRFYEINPEVRRLATSQFTYVSNCSGRVEIALGDARLTMEKESPQQFDLLALDAFSSDSIPVHLLTREAFALYRRHLKPNGVIAVHISNHFLNLEPVVMNLAREFNYRAAIIDTDENDERWWLYASTWVLLSQNRTLLDAPAISQAATAPSTKGPSIPLWTDDFASLYQILKRD